MSALQKQLLTRAGNRGLGSLDVPGVAKELRVAPTEISRAIAQLRADGFGAPTTDARKLDFKAAAPAANAARSLGWESLSAPADTAASIQKTLDAIVARGTAEGRSATHRSGDLFEQPMTALWVQLNSDEMKAQVKDDPFLKPLLDQVVMNLRHVRMDVAACRYPYEAAVSGLEDARDFFKVLGATTAQKITRPASPGAMQVEVEALKRADTAAGNEIIADPMTHYRDFSARLTKLGPNAPFPEFGNMVRLLQLKMSMGTAKELSETHPHLGALRQLAFDRLEAVSRGGLPYKDTIEAIQRATGFFDVLERGRPGGVSSPLYHSRRWQYHAHIMKAEAPRYILLPTQLDLSMQDLLKLRGTPLGFVGVTTEPIYADGHWQTPLEFFFHDVNHSRRMWQQLQDRAMELGVPVEEFAQLSNDYVWNKLVPIMNFPPNATEEEKDVRRVAAVLLFEILHEDALPADKGTLQSSLSREPFEEGSFLFETLAADERSISYTKAPNATVEAITFRKLEGEFYDMASMRVDGLGTAGVRTREFVARAAQFLNETLELGIDPRTIAANVLDDSGLPLDLRSAMIEKFKQSPETTVPPNEAAAQADFEKTGTHRGPPPFFIKTPAAGA